MPKSRRSAPLSPEQAVVLACARSELTPAWEARLQRLLAGPLDWRELWKTAYLQGVDYFVCRHLRRLAANPEARWTLPATFEDLMRKELWQSQVQNHVLRDTQLLLAAEFERAGVAVVWLKGLALSRQLYGRCEARQSVDLDLLTEPADVPRVEACLGLHGFAHEHHLLDEHFMNAHHRVWTGSMVRGGTLTVEVHHRLTGPEHCQPPAAELLRRSRRVRLRGKSLPVPAREDELLLLCLHAHHHNFSYLLSLMDVAEYVRRFHAEIDWPAFMANCRRWRCRGRAAAALHVAFATLEEELPAEVAPLLRGLTPLQRRVLRHLTPDVLLERGGDESDGRRLRLALLMDDWPDVMALLQPHALPPRAYAEALCPEPWRRLPGFANVWHLLRVSRRFLKL